MAHGAGLEAGRTAELARLVNDVNVGEYVEPTRTTLAAYLDQWLADYAKPTVSTRTFERYEEIVRLHLKPALGGHILAHLKPLHIQTYYTDAPNRPADPKHGKLSSTTILHVHRVPRGLEASRSVAAARSKPRGCGRAPQDGASPDEGARWRGFTTLDSSRKRSVDACARAACDRDGPPAR